MKNIRVYFIALCFIAVSATLFYFKMSKWNESTLPGLSGELWDVVIQMNYAGKGDRARVRLTLPQDNNRQIVYHEDFDHNLAFAVRTHERTKNRMGYWTSDLLDQGGSVRYSFSTQLRERRYVMPVASELPQNPEGYPEAIQYWLRPSKHIQSQGEKIDGYLNKILGKRKRSKDVAVITEKIFKFVRGEVKYQSEKGSKDAGTTLDTLVADCGGQARLFVAFNRAAGIPSRLVGGIIMEKGVKSVTHVWAENFIDGNWIPFDVVNNHFAAVPKHYLDLYRGDYALIKHYGLQAFEYFFVIDKGKIPPADPYFSLYSLPLPFQNSVKLLFLIPIGVLVVTLFRVVVGIPTYGTFAPIILALAFREISLNTGLVCLGIMLMVGCLLRAILDWLKILVIPRISLVITMVVMMTVGIMLTGNLVGEGKLLYISLFPLIIITWTIERFSVVQIEDGTLAAVKILAGTVVVAVAVFKIMERPELRFYLFTFPELLLSVIGLLLLLGRYTGLRLTELWRFRELHKIRKQSLSGE